MSETTIRRMIKVALLAFGIVMLSMMTALCSMAVLMFTIEVSEIWIKESTERALLFCAPVGFALAAFITMRVMSASAMMISGLDFWSYLKTGGYVHDDTPVRLKVPVNRIWPSDN